MSRDPVSIAELVGALLDEHGLRYAVGGAVASTLLGEPRATQDVDVLVELSAAQLTDLIPVLEASGFYVPETAAAQAVHLQRSFNIVHIDSAVKVDIFVAGRTPLDADELARARRIQLETSRTLAVAAPEDLIAQKLRWFRDGGETSDRQWRDVLGLLKVQGAALDRTLLRASAARLAVEDLLDRALHQVGGSPEP